MQLHVVLHLIYTLEAVMIIYWGPGQAAAQTDGAWWPELRVHWAQREETGPGALSSGCIGHRQTDGAWCPELRVHWAQTDRRALVPQAQGALGTDRQTGPGALSSGCIGYRQTDRRGLVPRDQAVLGTYI
ncbi:hypothetical protein KIL84_001922 [Mauremys mutica]|uniref:Uncharacterized protein n=1 Tax=Mauremys mutica TaxID=74926 RepID=A0A9D4B4C1_9SAUR|nr:hypothetical protein KIL84_001922 [Mauremys mutica]